ncbi:chemotaxis protein CheA [Desulfuromonas sp.]|uniref:chemotaxis protein CheA n=1 Tax=Desulfuromonas sp. TaxID=892 RepID=UPI0025C6ADA5|nr:chemotaxis protein CheA [Desulfuromonas sp.]
METLFAALDTLTRIVQGKGEDEDFTLDLGPLVGRIESILGGGGAGGPGGTEQEIDPELLKVLTEYEEHRLWENVKNGRNLVRVKAAFDLGSFDVELAEITDTLKKEWEVISTLPLAEDLSDQIAFQILIGTSCSPEQISSRLDRDGLSVEAVIQGKKTGAKEEPAQETPPSASVADEDDRAGSESLRSISRTVRVDIEKLDSLMNIVGELVLSKGAIASINERLKFDGNGDLAGELQKATRTLERRLEELQKGVLEVRMVPVGQLFEKMTRIVRRVAHEHDKKVALEIHGAETELDKLIVEDLSDPLMHIIRNAIDHGIESAAERQSRGKPEKGTIRLNASQKGNHVVIEVNDDGRGIDPDKVRGKALEKELIEEGTELSREDIYDLIFLPGFSTCEEVSDLSGRGVGMDVVKNNISALSGMIEIDSKVGQGTAITITLPITLAIIKALIIRVSTKTYAVPINAVMETLMVEPGEIRTIERREVIQLRESTLPLLRLGEVFQLAGSKRGDQRCFVAVVGLAEKRMGIVVDELLGQQDVVIKSLGSSLSFVKGIAGAADLGNQKTILVLDVGGLMSETLRGDTAFYV